MRYVLLLLAFVASPTWAQNWVRLSETDQGPRFVDLRSAVRHGRYASIDTELRMKPVIKRRERFDCGKRRILMETYTVMDMHQPKLTPSGREWVLVQNSDDSAKMLKFACGKLSNGGPR